jgi:hypothetical protein
MAMTPSRRTSGATSPMVMPPSADADANTAWLVSIAVLHRLFLAQALEMGPVRVGAEQLAVAAIERLERQRMGPLACRMLNRIAGAIGRSVHVRLPPPWRAHVTFKQKSERDYIAWNVPGQAAFGRNRAG